DGFSAGTLIKTSAGYVAIEQLQSGDLVFCFDELKQVAVTRPIIHIAHQIVESYVQLCIDEEIVCADLGQQLYDRKTNHWIKVHELLDQNIFAKHASSLGIDHICLVHEPQQLYSITVN